MSADRLLDANANRAREGLRVLEDLARFVLDDAPLAGEAKALRHALTIALPRDLALHRDTPGDVGTTLTAAGERDRPDLRAVAAAAASSSASAGATSASTCSSSSAATSSPA